MSLRSPSARNLGVVFPRSAALASGITPAQLKGPNYQALFRGYYVTADNARDRRRRIAAAVLIHPPGAVASHLSAADLYGLPVPPQPEVHVTVARERDRRPRHGIRSHLNKRGIAVEARHGIPISGPVDTFIALGYELGLVDLVVLGDAMVAAKLTTPQTLVAATQASHQKGVKPARRAARFVRRGVDSPMETRLRMLLVLAGLPEPEINHILREATGEWIVRLDLSYPGVRLIIEYDGRQHAEDTEQWNLDIERRENFDAWGWKIVVVTSRGIYKEPELTLKRVAAALRQQGHPVPSKLSSAWRPHFPTS